MALKCQVGPACWASSSIMYLVGRPLVGSSQSCFLCPQLPPWLWAGIPPAKIPNLAGPACRYIPAMLRLSPFVREVHGKIRLLFSGRSELRYQLQLFFLAVCPCPNYFASLNLGLSMTVRTRLLTPKEDLE